MFLSESVLFALNLFGMKILVTDLLFTSFLYACLMIILVYLYKNNNTIYNIINKCFIFIQGVGKEITHTKEFSIFFFFLFILIAISNTMRCFGFFPINGLLYFPLIYALMVFIIGFVYGFKVRKFRFFWGLVPSQVPLALKPILVFIETIVLFTKPITLFARLFLNIAIGHIVIHSLETVAHSFGNFSIIALPILVLINFVEIGIGLLQAYIFVIFSSLFIANCIEDH